MDNDIIERAKEYADRRLKGTEISNFGVATVYGYKDIYNANMTAYERGAKEQKDIDDAKWLKIKSSWEKEAQINHNDELNYKQGYHDAIEKFREWLRNNWREYVYQDRDGIIHFGHWESDFHKVMGE